MRVRKCLSEVGVGLRVDNTRSANEDYIHHSLVKMSGVPVDIAWRVDLQVGLGLRLDTLSQMRGTRFPVLARVLPQGPG